MPHSERTIKNENRWYRLDNAAKIYPAISSASHANVFRVAVRLKEAVNPKILQEALELTLRRFPSFDVRMQKGMFWYYLENNPSKPVVTPEKAPICRPIFLKETNGYLFRVSYYNTRMSLEVFHVVADGTGAIAFLKSLLYEYLLLEGKNVEADDGILDVKMYPSADEVEDSFQKYYDPNIKSSRAEKKAYTISGTRISPEAVRVTHGIIPIDEYKHLAKHSGVTVTQYTAALMIYSIYETQLKGKGSRLPVKVSVPINLRSFFPSQTLRNFTSYVNVGLVISAREYTFEEILSTISDQIKNDVQKEKLIEKIGANVSAERSPFMRLAPLFLKSIALKTAYFLYGERLVTSTLSNLGMINLPESMAKYVERFEFVLGAPVKNMMNCAMCTTGEKLTISFSRVMEETEIERFLFRFLSRQGLHITIESNYGALS